MSSCQRVQIQRPMSQAPRDPSTTATTMVATPLSTATQRGLEPKRSQSAMRSDVKKKKKAGYFKLRLHVKNVS